MSEQFVPVPFHQLVTLSLSQIRKGHFWGIPSEKFFKQENQRFSVRRFGKQIETPFGVAAGPHSQMAQNIVAAWLCGARYLELKTVQTLDRIGVSKPCIDMQDEGYNCEWSQELTLDESFDQYLDAWILIHVLHHCLGYEGTVSSTTIFNMSVGYNLEGILKPNVQQFFARMADCSALKSEKIKSILAIYPAINDIAIPDCLSDNITLSTMHGCPPDEIEKIGLYLILEKKLHTVVKLNPTLNGPGAVRGILNERMGYRTPVPDEAFKHDLKYPDAIRIITNLSDAAEETGVYFGVKLTNTLESLNFRKVFSPSEKQTYMSGRALHPLAVNLALKLRNDIGDALDISFAGGADAFNIPELLAARLTPVTVCSDLLKPGGYARMHQYFEELDVKMKEAGANSLEGFAGLHDRSFLQKYVDNLGDDEYYRKPFREPSVKTIRPLNPFDCIAAPCVNTCPANQDIPEYMYRASQGDFAGAFSVILRTNPFPGVTGAICDHDCQTRCTRVNYDHAVSIREVKRYIAGRFADSGSLPHIPQIPLQASIIGAGPAGMSCAWYLRQAGFRVTVYEASGKAGGMVASVIPRFRIDEKILENDISRIVASGVEIKYNQRISSDEFRELHEAGHYIFLASGAPEARKLGLPGEESAGVVDPLLFLADCKQGLVTSKGKKVVVIGGGNTAMDVARAARLTLAHEGTVTIVYRRSRREMPADAEEILAAQAEGIEVVEMAMPEELLTSGGAVTGLRCLRTEFSGEEADGRPRIVPVPGLDFIIPADVVIPALGQKTGPLLAEAALLKTTGDGYATRIPRVYLGGDMRKGAANIIGAVADGRKAAETIAAGARRDFPEIFAPHRRTVDVKDLMLRKSVRKYNEKLMLRSDGHQPPILTGQQAVEEASRCLLCDEVCNICVTVCPNLANQSYMTAPVNLMLKKVVVKPGGDYEVIDDIPFVVAQSRQVLNIGNFCNECGNCVTFCPTAGSPFRDKPTFWLTAESFEEADEGYFMDDKNGCLTIRYKSPEGFISMLQKTDRGYVYESPEITALLDAATLYPEEIKSYDSRIPEVRFQMAARLRTLMDAGQVVENRLGRTAPSPSVLLNP